MKLPTILVNNTENNPNIDGNMFDADELRVDDSTTKTKDTSKYKVNNAKISRNPILLKDEAKGNNDVTIGEEYDTKGDIDKQNLQHIMVPLIIVLAVKVDTDKRNKHDCGDFIIELLQIVILSYDVRNNAVFHWNENSTGEGTILKANLAGGLQLRAVKDIDEQETSRSEDSGDGVFTGVQSEKENTTTFIAMQQNNGDCDGARENMEKISDLAYLPLVQGTHLHTHEVSKRVTGEKRQAKSAVFQTDILPEVYSQGVIGRTATQIIYDDIGVSNDPQTSLLAVKEAFGSVYEAIGFDWKMVRG